MRQANNKTCDARTNRAMCLRVFARPAARSERNEGARRVRGELMPKVHTSRQATNKTCDARTHRATRLPVFVRPAARSKRNEGARRARRELMPSVHASRQVTNTCARARARNELRACALLRDLRSADSASKRAHAQYQQATHYLRPAIMTVALEGGGEFVKRGESSGQPEN